MYIQIATTIVHPFWCYLFTDVLNWGLIGPPLAQSLSHFINIVVLSVYLGRLESFKEMWFWPNADCFKGLTNYLKIGMFSMGLIWLEWCAFEFLTFFSGFLDVDSTAAQIILFNFECLIYMVGLSLSIAGSAHVGRHIGAGKVELA